MIDAKPKRIEKVPVRENQKSFELAVSAKVRTFGMESGAGQTEDAVGTEGTNGETRLRSPKAKARAQERVQSTECFE